MGASAYYTPLEGDGGLSSRLRGLTLNAKSGNLLPLEKQTEQLVEDVMTGAKKRRAARGELSAFGRETWEKASWKDLIGKEDTVDVDRKWLPPVVQVSSGGVVKYPALTRLRRSSFPVCTPSISLLFSEIFTNTTSSELFFPRDCRPS